MEETNKHSKKRRRRQRRRRDQEDDHNPRASHHNEKAVDVDCDPGKEEEGGGLEQHRMEKKKKKSNDPNPNHATTAITTNPQNNNNATYYPYRVDYNDHFETPRNAFVDICPLLDYVHANNNSDGNNNNNNNNNARSNHVLYDPYYCQGASRDVLRSLGFQKVVHEKRDFYKDIADETIPENYQTLVTNPPYSDDHKQRCLDFAFEQLSRSGQQNRRRSFFLLMPSYIATKQYYREALLQQQQRGDAVIVYVVPSDSYEYHHPDGTGHDIPPFFSIWYCGIPVTRSNNEKNTNTTNIRQQRIEHLLHHWNTFQKNQQEENGGQNQPRLATSLEELQLMGIIPSEKRPNPKQRRKRKKQFIANDNNNPTGGSSSSIPNKNHNNNHNKTEQQIKSSSNRPLKTKKTSKYRDEKGTRTKKRF